MRTSSRFGSAAILFFLLLHLLPTPALADNCSGLSDCFRGNMLPAILLILGLLLLIGLIWYFGGWAAIGLGIRGLIGAAGRSGIARWIASRFAGRSAGRFLFQNWSRGTFPNRMQSLRYHWGKHGQGLGKSFSQYTRDARNFFSNNKNLGKPWNLKDGSQGVKISTGKGNPGGIFTSDGKIVTFWYK